MTDAPSGSFVGRAAPSVVIVGGGISGISAAVSLRKQGFQVRILEARRRLGGRAGSFEDNVTGKNLDYCQHVGMACCTHLVWFLKCLKIDTFWNRQEVLHFYASNGRHLPVKASPLPAPLHLSGLLWRWPGLSTGDRVNVAWGLWKLMRLPPSESLNNVLATEWLRKIGQRTRVIDRFWATILVSALGDQMDRVNLGATRKVLVDGFAANRNAYHLLVPQSPLSDLLGERGADSLEELGIQITCSTAIQECQWRENRCEAVVSRDGTVYKADHFVFAVPWHRLAKLTGNNCDVSSLNHLDSAPITGIHTWWDKDWLEEPHAILVDRLCQWIFKDPMSERNPLKQSADTPAKQTNETYFQVVISGFRNLPRGDTNHILELVHQDLAEIFPKAAQSKLLRGRVVTDPQSVFSVAPGHQGSRFPSDRFSEQNIWLAGDWTDTKWPATMEGAVRSGITAANHIAQIHKTPKLLISDLKRGRLANWIIA